MPPQDRPSSRKSDRPPDAKWHSIWWYIPLAILMLWLWQDFAYMLSVHTVAYSEFKQYVARGQVQQCDIKEDEIVGKIVQTSQIDCSDDTAHDIDLEVKKLLDSAYDAAKTILTDHRDQLDSVAEELIHRETIDAATFHRLLGQQPSEPLPAST